MQRERERAHTDDPVEDHRPEVLHYQRAEDRIRELKGPGSDTDAAESKSGDNREPDAHLGLLELGLSMGQWLSLPMVLAGALLWLWARRQPP